jgi:hypothetical protein
LTRNTEIAELDESLLVDEDVRRLDVYKLTVCQYTLVTDRTQEVREERKNGTNLDA